MATLARYHLLHAARGDLLARLDRHDEARAEFERAAAMTANEREKALLLERAARGARALTRHAAPGARPTRCSSGFSGLRGAAVHRRLRPLIASAICAIVRFAHLRGDRPQVAERILHQAVARAQNMSVTGIAAVAPAAVACANAASTSGTDRWIVTAEPPALSGRARASPGTLRRASASSRRCAAPVHQLAARAGQAPISTAPKACL